MGFGRADIREISIIRNSVKYPKIIRLGVQICPKWLSAPLAAVFCHVRQQKEACGHRRPRSHSRRNLRKSLMMAWSSPHRDEYQNHQTIHSNQFYFDRDIFRPDWSHASPRWLKNSLNMIRVLSPLAGSWAQNRQFRQVRQIPRKLAGYNFVPRTRTNKWLVGK